jgi:hypothetical protein
VHIGFCKFVSFRFFRVSFGFFFIFLSGFEFFHVFWLNLTPEPEPVGKFWHPNPSSFGYPSGFVNLFLSGFFLLLLGFFMFLLGFEFF